ncbi:antitoxin [Gordonia sp. zg691]|uniref:antitoxin n=1 Tax=Gordonia jinghuaiqii TaxID=2758710 RepID=UPI00166224EB|nr:antitoxin [Gordonia jinghuaiqii]MBD0862359.1 antitoxin [Gordonia jinghuaiqii]
MDLKGLVNKARAALQKNPHLIEKGGDAIDKATKNKYAGQVNKAQDAVRKAVGTQNPHNPQNPQNPNPQNPNPQNPNPQNPNPQNPPQ